MKTYFILPARFISLHQPSIYPIHGPDKEHLTLRCEFKRPTKHGGGRPHLGWGNEGWKATNHAS